MRTIPLGNEGSVNPTLRVQALDEPGAGGACHHYWVTLSDDGKKNGKIVTEVKFQNGAIHEAGINGSTNEALLAIIIDRLQGFSNGPFPSHETSLALTKCQEALHWLEHRTRERDRRGVEGKHEA